MDFLRSIFIDRKDREYSQIRPFWRGHLFLFDRPSAPAYSSQAGTKLLAIFALLEFLLRPVLVAAARWLTLADHPWWTLTQVTILTLLGGWLVTGFAGVPLSQLGLYSWRNWSKTEKVLFFTSYTGCHSRVLLNFFSEPPGVLGTS
jgi:hypothetical protein